jgi:hypothetical protein
MSNIPYYKEKKTYKLSTQEKKEGEKLLIKERDDIKRLLDMDGVKLTQI